MRLRFSLRNLLIVITIVAVLLGVGAQFVFRVKGQARRHRAACERLESFGYWVGKETRFPHDNGSNWLVAFSRRWIDSGAYPSPANVDLCNELLTAKQAEERLAIVRDLGQVLSLTIHPDVFDAEYVELLRSFETLGELNIEAREMANSAGSTIAELRSLSALVIGEPIDDESLAGIAKLPNLTTLTLDAGQLTGRAIDGANGFPKLRELTLLGDVRDPGPIGAILRPASIEELDLSMCRLSANALIAIENAHSVSRLTVGGDDGNEELFRHLARLKNLQTFHAYGLRSSQLQQVGELAACERLTEMTLTGTKLTEEDFLRFTLLAQLRLLHLDGDLRSEAAEAFLRLAPNCQIRVYSAKDQWKVFRIVDGKMECSERKPGY